MDATAWVAIVGIVATLIGTLAGTVLTPVSTEIVRRRSVRKERMLALRLEAYADLLRVGARFVNNAITVASLHDGDIREPDDDELNRLTGQVKLVASDDVAEHFKAFSEQVGRFQADVFMAKLNHKAIALRNPEDDLVEGVKSVHRVALRRKTDAIRGTYRELEAAIRKDVQA